MAENAQSADRIWKDLGTKLSSDRGSGDSSDALRVSGSIPESVPEWTIVEMAYTTTYPSSGRSTTMVTDVTKNLGIVIGGQIYPINIDGGAPFEYFRARLIGANEGTNESDTGGKGTSSSYEAIVSAGFAMSHRDVPHLVINMKETYPDQEGPEAGGLV